MRIYLASTSNLHRVPGCVWGGEEGVCSGGQDGWSCFFDCLTLRLVSHHTSSSDQFSWWMFPGWLDLKLLIPLIPLHTAQLPMSRALSSFCWWWSKPHWGNVKRYSKKDRLRKQHLLGEFLSSDSRPTEDRHYFQLFAKLNNLLFVSLFPKCLSILINPEA